MGFVRTSLEIDVEGVGAAVTSVGESDHIEGWSVSGAPNGRYVVAWQDARGTDSVRAQVFGPDGSVIGAQIRVLDASAGAQITPKVVMLSNDTFVVAWHQQDVNGYSIEAQTFSLSSGTPVPIGGRVNYPRLADLNGEDLLLTRLSDSTFLMTHYRRDDANYTQVGQVIEVSPSGGLTKVGGEFTIETTTASARMAVDLLSPSTFVVTWKNFDAADIGAKTAVLGQIYAFGAGTPTKVGTEFVVASSLGSLGEPAVRVLAPDRFVVAFDRADNLTVQLMTATSGGATKVGDSLSIPFGVLGPRVPAIGVLSSSEFAVFGRGWSAYDIVAEAGGLRMVGAAVTDSNTNENEQDIQVAATGPGQFVAVWNDYEIPFSGPNVQGMLVAQTFANAGTGMVDEAPVGTAGPDQFDGRDGADTILGLGGTDLLRGGAGDDRVFGGLGNDIIQETSGSNYLRGDEGDDDIVGGSGFDDINGNMGNDTARGAAGDDWVVGGKDNDVLYGEAGADLVYGNLGNDTLSGGDGNDVVRGGQDNDIVRGGNGADFISGDRGNDTMYGGSDTGAFVSGDGAADIFHTFADAGIDRVMDFESGKDRVMLAPGTQYTVNQVGDDTVISMTGGAQMTLVGIRLSALSSDWIFGA